MNRTCSCSSLVIGQTTLWEGGHYYTSKGPTKWSVIGWQILTELRDESDHAMVFVDDVHGIKLVDPMERSLEVIPDFSPQPCFTIKESDMAEAGFEVLDALKKLPKRHRARETYPQRWFCSGHALTSANGCVNGEPLCLLYDLGLILHKHQLGFRRAVNVLPKFYEKEQRGLMRIARKVMPDMQLSAILYDLDGNWRWLRHPADEGC